MEPLFRMYIVDNTVVRKYLAVATVLLVVSSPVSLLADEIRYVSGNLTLKMYKDLALSELLPSLKSGDRLFVLKWHNAYAQVEMADGTVGWVKSSYLQKDKPAVIRLLEVQEELDRLRSKHTDLLIEQPNDVTLPDNQLRGRVDAAESAQQSMNQRVKELEEERLTHMDELRELRQDKQGAGGSKYMLLWVVLPIMIFISGFFIGYKTLEGKIRARFGGHYPL